VSRDTRIAYRRMPGALLPALLTLVLSAGCDLGGAGSAAGSGRSSGYDDAPFAVCSALTAPPVAAMNTAGSDGTSASGRDGTGEAVRPLPDLDLPCFTGGQTVPVGAIRGPAVVNLWASWCGPCRVELPAFQRLAERTEGELHVIGVNTRDDAGRARSVGEDLGLTFATLVDREERLRLALERVGLPLTLFVDEQGEIRHVHQSTALDDAVLAELAGEHLHIEAGR